MHINNIIAGLLGFLLALVLVWLLWTPMGLITGALPTELSIITSMGWITMIILACILVPMNLVASEENR